MNAEEGSTGVNVITFPLLVACTMPLTGSPVSGSTWTSALTVAAMWAASEAASVSPGPAAYVTVAWLTVVISVSPGATVVAVIVAWQAAGTGGAAA